MTRAYMRVMLGMIYLLLAVSSCIASEVNPAKSLSLTSEELAWLEEHKDSIRLCPDPNFAPIEIKAPYGGLGGLAGDYLKIIEEKLNIKIKVIWYPTWADSVEAAKKGDVDMWSAVVPTPQREEYMSFTTPYFDLRPVFVARSTYDYPIDLTNFGNKKIVVVKGWYHEDLLRKQYPYLKIHTVSTLLEGMRSVSEGDFDVLITDIIEASHIFNERLFPNLRVVADAPITANRIAFACRKEWTIFRGILQKALDSISEEQRKKISNRWISLKNDASSKNIICMYIGMTLLIFVSGISIWQMRPQLLWVLREIKKMPLEIPLALLILAVMVALNHEMLFKTTEKKLVLTADEQLWISSHKNKLRIAPDVFFAPIESIDNNGHQVGIAADYVALLEKRLDVKFNILKIDDWSENISLAKDRKVDIWSAAAATTKKHKFMTFTKPYLSLQTILLVNKGVNDTLRLNNAGGRRIAVVKGYYTHDYLSENFPKLSLHLVSDSKEGMRALAFHEVDGFFTDLATSSYLVEHDGFSMLHVAEIVDSKYNISFASRSDWPILSSILQKGLDSITPSERKEIYNKWIVYDISVPWLTKKFIYIAIVSVAIIVIIILWNIILRRRVGLKTRQLADSEARYKAIFEYANDGIFLMDNEIIEDCNAKALSLFRCSREDIIGYTPLRFSPEKQDGGGLSIEIVFDRISCAYAGSPQLFEWTHLRNDGTLFKAEVSLNGLDVGDRRLILVFVRDITERKHMEESLFEAQKMESVGQLAGGVAHDFNNMLGGIMASAELLELELTSNKEATKYIDMIIKTAEKAARLTSKLLAFARRQPQVFSIVDIHQIINDTVTILGRTAGQAIKINTDLKAIIFMAYGNQNQLQSALVSLGVNSLHAMKSGGTLTLSTRMRDLDKEFCSTSTFELKTGRYIEIKIVDTGVGIPEEILLNIFEPFYTTDEFGRGAGLGLAAVYGTVQQHHGAISVYSRVNHGTSVEILLPISCKHSHIHSEVKRVPMSGSGSVLVVDDEMQMRVTAESILKNHGCSVTLCESGFAALSLMKEAPNAYDLIILDSVMPMMSGKECLEQLRVINPTVCVLLASTETMPQGLKDMAKYGLSGVVNKPFRMATLIEAVDKIIKS